MTNAELIAKIKAEIERRMEELDEQIVDIYDSKAVLRKDELQKLLSFLSTLESEKPINPNDAMKELDEKIALVKQRGTWDGVDVDKYMDEVRGRESEKPVPNDLEEAANRFAVFYDQGTCDGITQECFIAGAKWDREQMMKEAVEGEIQMRYSGGLCAKTIRAINEDKFKFGDKVRVIVLPKEDGK